MSWNPNDNEASSPIHDLITEIDPDTDKEVLCVLLVKVSLPKNYSDFMVHRDSVTLNEPRPGLDWRSYCSRQSTDVRSPL